MGNQYYSDWESLVAAADSKASSILKKEIAPVARRILKEHIESDIYAAYTPKLGAWVNGTTYQRRKQLPKNVQAYLIDDHTLLVTSTAAASPSVVKGYRFVDRYDGALLKLIEVGHTGIWRGGFPRPAVSNTEKEFDGNRDINNAILRGIERVIGKSELIA